MAGKHGMLELLKRRIPNCKSCCAVAQAKVAAVSRDMIYGLRVDRLFQIWKVSEGRCWS